MDSISGTNLRGWMFRWVLVPALLVAAGFLAWWTWRTTKSLERLADLSILDSTRLLTREKVDRVDQLIIQYDNAVNHLVNPDDLDPLVNRWAEGADRISPTVRSVLVLDEARRVLRHVSRDPPPTAARFRALFERRVLEALALENDAPGAHRHLHDVFDGQTVMVSALTREVAGRRFYVVLETDLAYIQQYVLPDLFDDPAARGQFNVVDESGRYIYGKALTASAEFVVSRRFPTTLYKWSLSVAARHAPEIETGARRRRLLDVLLVSLSLSVLVAGVAFLAYAARNAQRLNRLKSDFIATVSHELKTPLSLIRMFGEMLATERVPTEQKRKQYLEIIVRESERLTALIENVLDFAKLERGKAAYEFSRGNLGEVVTRGVELFRYRLASETPRLAVLVADGIPDSDLDERALQLLLFNLLDNAVKYAGAGERIDVRVRGSGRTVSLEVEDDGPGIDPDDERRVFERFYRGRTASAGGARGSGIGLALVKHIAHAHGGDVSVQRGVRGGALFTVTLPVRAQSSDASRDAPRAGADGAAGDHVA